MSSMTGYITYVEYSAGLTKGETTQGDVFNNPFKLGKVDANYTSSRIVEPVLAGTSATLSWTPVQDGFTVITVGGKVVEFDERETYTEAELKTKTVKSVKITKADKSVVFADAVKGTNDDGAVEYTVADVAVGDKIAYVYDNVVVPQGADKIPTIKAEMKSMALLAKARRIAVYYSQIAAFQAKTDYGFDLGDQLAEKAVGQLSYEIDTEIVNLLDETAGEGATKVYADKDVTLTWNREHTSGVSKADHYEGFSEVIEVGRQIVYDRTKRFAPNYMIIASDVLPILTFMKGFQAAPAGQINGPYFAGTLNGLKVYVSPAIKAGRFLLGVNGDDMMSSVAVYAPYMAIVPTQLLQYADGGTSQGWSTMYDLKVLNKDLIVAGQVEGEIFGVNFGN